jgi:hypothetical protein
MRPDQVANAPSTDWSANALDAGKDACAHSALCVFRLNTGYCLLTTFLPAADPFLSI